ncbi:MAG: hypothetical protein E7254_06100 [Lachnospiraceae bacterium]|nr:hypothetical protein [Lachnospiraceae bacterium]
MIEKIFKDKLNKNISSKSNTLYVIAGDHKSKTTDLLMSLKIEGTVLFASPITSLLVEIADKLRGADHKVLELHDEIEAKHIEDDLKDYANEIINPKFIFVSPSTIATDGLFEYCIKKRIADISLFVIDEVQRMSQWGMSFRPFYQRIPDFLDSVYEEERFPVLGITGSLDQQEISDVCEMLNIERGAVIKEEVEERSDIQVHIQRIERDFEIEDKIFETIEKHKSEKILVYVYREERKKRFKTLLEKASERGYNAALLNEGMTSKKRDSIIEKYNNEEINIIFTEDVYGVGIDLKGISVVIHYKLPESLDQYYREIAHIDKNEKNTHAYLWYSNLSIDIKKRGFIDEEFPSEQMAVGLYATFAKRRGIKVFNFKEEDNIQSCLPYYAEAGILRIIGKGFTDLVNVTNINDSVIQKICDSSKNKTYGRVIKDNELTVKEVSNIVYGGLVDSKFTTAKPLKKCMVIDVIENEITFRRLKVILVSISDKKKYRHEQLDSFVHILTKFGSDSNVLHQKLMEKIIM